jgi:SHS2 domain-containing protein
MKKKKTMFNFIEHTADMGLEAQADSRAAVFAEMARGLFCMLYGNSPVTGVLDEEVMVRGDDPVELLVAWLNELVYRIEMNDFVIKDVVISTIDKNELIAKVSGELFDAERHRVERQLKSVTYHQACVEERAGGWYARVYIDL